MIPRWSFVLASSDLMEPIDQLKNASDRQLTPFLNKGGSLGFRLPIEDDAAYKLEPLSTCVIAYRTGVPKWSGPITAIDEDPITGVVNVGCVGWLETLVERLFKTGIDAPGGATTSIQSHTYSAQDAGLIAMNMLYRANAEQDTYMKVGSIDLSQIRTITVSRYASIGAEIARLVDIEAGFDLELDPISRELHVRYGQVKDEATIYGRGSDRRDAVFGYGTIPHNVSNASRRIDGSTVRTRQIVSGKYHTISMDDPDAQLRYGLREQSSSLADVVDKDIVSAFAAAELTALATPKSVVSFTPVSYNGELDVPEPFEDYDLGDIVYYAGNRGRHKIPETGTDPQPVRVFSIPVTIDDSTGAETIGQIQTRYEGG